jgi:hypothetical protein
MAQFDSLIIFPLILSLLFSLFFYYNLSIGIFIPNFFGVKKFREKKFDSPFFYKNFNDNTKINLTNTYKLFLNPAFGNSDAYYDIALINKFLYCSIVDPVVINIIAGLAIGLSTFTVFLSLIEIITQIIKSIGETVKTIGEIIVKKSNDLIDLIKKNSPSSTTIGKFLIYLKDAVREATVFNVSLVLGWIIGQLIAILLKK